MNARLIYDKFKKLCPHSKERYVNTNTNVQRWLHHIMRIEETMLRIELNPPKMVDETTLRLYQDACSKRLFTSFNDIPEYIKDRLNGRISIIRERYKDVQEIYLTGSYARGNYIDERTTVDFIELKRKVKGTHRIKVSDFDFILVPGIKGITESLGKDIHLVNDIGRTKFLVWKKEK